MLRVVINRPVMERALIRRNITQHELAGKLKVSRGYVSLMIQGKRRVPAPIRRALLQYLRGYSFDDLFVIETIEEGDGGDAAG